MKEADILTISSDKSSGPALPGKVAKRSLLRRIIRITAVLLLLLPGVLSLCFSGDDCRFPVSATVPALLLPVSDVPVKVLYCGHPDMEKILPQISECVSEVRIAGKDDLPEDYRADLILLERLPELRAVSDRKFLKKMVELMDPERSVLVLPARCAAALPPGFTAGILLPGDGLGGSNSYLALGPRGMPPPADAAVLEERWLKRFDEEQRPLTGVYQAIYPDKFQVVETASLRRNALSWPFSVDLWFVIVPVLGYLLVRFFMRRSEAVAGDVDRMENIAAFLLSCFAAVYYSVVWSYLPELSFINILADGRSSIWMLAGMIPLLFSWRNFGVRRTVWLIIASALMLWNNEFPAAGFSTPAWVVFLQWLIPLVLSAAATGAVACRITADLPQISRARVALSSFAGFLPVLYAAALFMAYGRIEIVLAAAAVFRLAGVQRCAER